MVAVETATGPHVTPQAFAAAAGHAWLVAPARSAKVRALRRRPRVALLFGDHDRSLLATGRAEVLGPLDLARIGPALAMAGGDYLARNGTLVAGIGTDVLLGALAPPVDRVLIRVTTHRHLQLGEGEPDVAVAVGSLGVELPAGCDEVALGLLTDDGPVVVPVRWDDASGTARLRSADLDAVGAGDRTSACLTVASSPGARPSAFAGLLLRGELRRGAPGEAARLVVARRSWWDGYATGSSSA